MSMSGAPHRHRWIVRTRVDPEDPRDGRNGRGSPLRAFRSFPAAKRYAERVAYDHYYGVVIDDTEARVVYDFIQWMDYSGRVVPSRTYAQPDVTSR